MPKTLTKIAFGFFDASVLCAAVLRCVQLFLFTDISTGFVLKEASFTAGAVYILCVSAVVLCGIFFHKKLTPADPFSKKESKPLFYICIITGAAMFYDFIHQCVNCFNYASRTTYFELNYFVPMLLTGIAAILCTFYFIIMGVSFVTDKYDFKQLVYFHLALAVWFISGFFIKFTSYDDGYLAVENNLRYAVLLFGIMFSIALIRGIDGVPAKPRTLCFAGLAYAALSFILAAPRIIAFIGGAELNKAEFSSVSYLFTGIFAAVLTIEALKKDKTKEV